MKRIITLLFLVLIPAGVFCQLIPTTDQYLLSPMSINPAFAGGRSALSASLFYRNQWMGMNGSPKTGTFSIDAPLLGERIGLGLSVTTDKIGVTKEEQVMTNYAFRIAIGGGTLSMGIGAGLVITNTAWSDLIVNDPGDEFYLRDSRTFFMPNFRFGLYYTYKKYFAGFSVPQFLKYSFDFDKDKYSLHNDASNFNYLFTTGYKFSLGKKMGFIPSTLLSYMPSEGFYFDLNAQVGYMDILWLGISYRSSKSLSALFQFQINSQLGVGYTYNYTLGTLGSYNTGTHEIMLRYEFHYKVDAINPLDF